METGTTFTISLVGTGEAIPQAIESCRLQQQTFASGLDTHHDQHERFRDEATAVLPPPNESYQFIQQPSTDFSGNDLRSALSDGFLVGMTQSQCERLCVATDGCLAYTHNANVNACFIKAGPGRPTRFVGANSGQLEGSFASILPPPTQGSGTIVDQQAAWGPGETIEDFHARIRRLAQPMGMQCARARQVVQEASRQLRVALPDMRRAAVGGSVQIDWRNNTLVDRVPFYLMVVADQPVRFGGRGFVALGPEAPNPFGLATGEGQHRAFVALHSRGAGFDGAIDVFPLSEGPVALEAYEVAYLPACQEEVTLDRHRVVITTQPGPARIVLNNPLSRRLYTHEVALDAFHRQILFNEDRILILDSDTGAEIVERGGSEFTVSSTHRFVVLSQDGRFDIVDVIDGQTVARIDQGDLFWGMGDSFAMSTRSPWAEANIVSTFGGPVDIREQITGPSCCLASPEETRIGIDLENAAVTIWGRFGYLVGSLQNPGFSVHESPHGGYSSDQSGSLALFQHELNSLGTVAPVTLGLGFEVAGGVRYTWRFGDGYNGGTIVDPPRSFDDILALRLGRVGLHVQRRFPGPEQPRSSRLQDQLLRLGLDVLPMDEGQVVLALDPGRLRVAEATALASGDTATAYRRQVEALGPFISEAAARGWRFTWSDESPFIVNYGPLVHSECYHVDLSQNEDAGNQLLLVRDIDQLVRLDAGAAPFWISQSWCTAGATFGSLRPTTVLNIYDLAGPVPRVSTDLTWFSAFFYENAPSPVWYGHPFTLRGNDRDVLFIAQGHGIIALFDRQQRQLVTTFEHLPNGDLLQSAYLTRDGRYVIQENQDGAFFVHSLRDHSIVLSGRVEDDEIAVWTADFRFDATAEAAELIDLIFPGRLRQYSLDRFAATRRVPGLLQRVLGEDRIPAAPATTVPPDIAGTIALNSEGIEARVQTLSGQVARFAVFQDGVLTNELDAAQSAKSIQVPRLPGARWVTIVGTDSGGLASAPVSVDLGPDTVEGHHRALVVAVNTYQDPAIPSLDFALRDGERFGQVMEASIDGAPGFESVAYLGDRHASPEAILQGVRDLVDGLGEGDHAVIYFAGHGLRGADGALFLGTSGTELSDLPETALAFDAIAQVLSGTSARVTILLDTCHSGSAGVGAFATTDDVVGDLSRLPTNVTILAASKGREFSQEDPSFGGGIFTFALEQVILRQRARYDVDGNGRIEASELYEGVKSIVVAAFPGQQTPWISQTRMVGDYALF